LTVHGTWEGELHSNFDTIKALDPALSGAPPASPVNVKAVVRARLFSIGMEIKSRPLNHAGPYMESVTLLAGAARHGPEERLRLTYVFEAAVGKALATDSSHHYGAAILTLLETGDGPEFEGPYWTNRNWEKGWNTAGRLRLRKLPASAPA
jgi:hypothetical protein